MKSQPSLSWATFSERGFSFEAFRPANDTEPHHWRVVMSHEDKPVFEYTADLHYDGLLGPDMADHVELEDVTDKVLAFIEDVGVLPEMLENDLKTVGITGHRLQGE